MPKKSYHIWSPPGYNYDVQSMYFVLPLRILDLLLLARLENLCILVSRFWNWRGVTLELHKMWAGCVAALFALCLQSIPGSESLD